MNPSVLNSCLIRVPVPSASNVATFSPRRIRLPNFVRKSRGGSAGRTPARATQSCGFRIDTRPSRRIVSLRLTARRSPAPVHLPPQPSFRVGSNEAEPSALSPNSAWRRGVVPVGRSIEWGQVTTPHPRGQRAPWAVRRGAGALDDQRRCRSGFSRAAPHDKPSHAQRPVCSRMVTGRIVPVLSMVSHEQNQLKNRRPGK